MSANNTETYLGFDFSTQQVKGILINSSLEILSEQFVSFDTDLPEYRTNGGVNYGSNPKSKVVTAPTIMWVKALDILMEKLRLDGVDFSSVAAISGAGQQHGSVYWRNGARNMLKQLSPDKFMHDSLAHAFSLLDSPIWMDSSTTAQCRALEEAIGGPQKLAEITGSRAIERFTGNQISKIASQKYEIYNNTENISLVSSFACSLFLGDYAPIDYSDAGGMNLFDNYSKDWSNECLEACGGETLKNKLLPPVRSSSIVGKISDYMIERYGFNPDCDIVAFTGDNPSALAGLRMSEGDIGISLGTSDTVFVYLKDPKPSENIGHIWVNPVDSEAYMALLCYKNGSLTRERIRNETSEGSWDIFNQLLDSTPRGNFGNMGIYLDNPEITPRSNIQGDYRFNKADIGVNRFASKEAEVRACIEGQFLAKRIHAEMIGFKIEPETRILVTGGASVNSVILQVISDIFNAPVYTQSMSNSSGLGACYRALHAKSNRDSYSEALDNKKNPNFTLSASPNKDAIYIYKPLIERYRNLESKIHNTHQS